jgi:hypothetical protein
MKVAKNQIHPMPSHRINDESSSDRADKTNPSDRKDVKGETEAAPMAKELLVDKNYGQMLELRGADTKEIDGLSLYIRSQ